VLKSNCRHTGQGVQGLFLGATVHVLVSSVEFGCCFLKDWAPIGFVG